MPGLAIGTGHDSPVIAPGRKPRPIIINAPAAPAQMLQNITKFKQHNFCDVVIFRFDAVNSIF
jgi:hypothetical protein